MTQNTQVDQAAQAPAEQKAKKNDEEFNFRRQQQMYEKMLAEKEARIAEIERKMQESSSIREEDDRDDEPYVDRRRLSKELNKFGQQTIQQTKTEIQQAVQQALAEERRQNWMKQNPDFHEVMSHAEKFAQMDPELAETILQMPEGFERQKLVYKNIKVLGLHKPPEAKTSIQDTVDRNRRGPYYQPTGQSAPPYGTYATTGKEISPQEGKNAYEHMKQLQQRLRIG